MSTTMRETLDQLKQQSFHFDSHNTARVDVRLVEELIAFVEPQIADGKSLKSTTFKAIMTEISPPIKPVSADGFFTDSSALRLVTYQEYDHNELVDILCSGRKLRVTIEELDE